MNKDCLEAFTALQRQTSLSAYVDPAYQQSQSPVVRMRRKHSKVLESGKGYAAIGEAYLKNPIPLVTRDPGPVADLTCVLPSIHLLNTWTKGSFQSRLQSDFLVIVLFYCFDTTFKFFF